MAQSIISLAETLNAEVSNLFSYAINKNENILEIFLRNEPTDEQKAICEKYGFSIKQNILHENGIPTTIWEVQHADVKDAELATTENILHGMINVFYGSNTRTWDSLMRALNANYYCKNEAETERLVLQMMHDWDVCPSGSDALVAKYAQFINEANK